MECLHIAMRDLCGTLLSTSEGNRRTDRAVERLFSYSSVDVNSHNSSFALLLASLQALCLYTTFSLPLLLT